MKSVPICIHPAFFFSLHDRSIFFNPFHTSCQLSKSLLGKEKDPFFCLSPGNCGSRDFPLISSIMTTAMVHESGLSCQYGFSGQRGYFCQIFVIIHRRSGSFFVARSISNLVYTYLCSISPAYMLAVLTSAGWLQEPGIPVIVAACRCRSCCRRC